MKNLKKMFEASIIVPTYNRSNLLEYSLHSLSLQDIDKSKYEVIVADDGSSDDTTSIVEKYRDRLNLKYVFQEDKGYRVASARNKAIGIAEGALCLFIDSGILLNANCLREHIDFHERQGPDCAAVGYVYGFDREGEAETRLKEMIDPEDPSGSIRRIAGHTVYWDIREKHYTQHADRIDSLRAPWIYFWTGNVSVSRINLLKVGMFDENYDGRWGVEDNDLGFRLNQSGVRIHLLRTAQCIHYPHNTYKPEKEKQGRENCTYFHKKFSTIETGLFLQYYGQDEFININALKLEEAPRLL